MSGKNITDGKLKLYDHTDNNRSRIWFFRPEEVHVANMLRGALEG
jgi:hypothetical protein